MKRVENWIVGFLVVLAAVFVYSVVHAQEVPLLTYGAGAVVGADGTPIVTNTNVRVVEVVPNVDFVVTLGAELSNPQGVENSVGLDGGPGVSIYKGATTVAYAFRQKSNDWQVVWLINTAAWNAATGVTQQARVEPELHNLYLSINRSY